LVGQGEYQHLEFTSITLNEGVDTFRIGVNHFAGGGYDAEVVPAHRASETASGRRFFVVIPAKGFAKLPAAPFGHAA
jgi:hypothetical protein